ncbi:uncharacterized protein FIESC28_04408 [Fusarium coffeatum]|uniref:Clr5 domain-containing protein n=1 Tax=Fusarium coffeatum TaxID=231269 RepID=A0A366RZV6_9HYPO|nr:uncharacterized protein FIESC28_04408 [Fusarium coffeatum]RBR22613.1 hypothetical protein FIESC28_04408 [Fusarium coffeatum]
MMAKPWNEHRGTITKLYIQEGRTLEDTRNIMRIQHNFEASIRSYRQHFDIWQIGKYNCKKRDKRRRQSLGKNLPPSPPHSPSDVPYYGEDGSSPVSSSSSSTSRRSSDQRPLPVLKQPQMYTAYFYDYARSQEDPQIKVENNGREPVWENIDVGAFRNSQVVDGVLPSGVPIQPYPESAGWPVRGARSSYLASPPQTYCRAPFQDPVSRYVPETTLYSRGGEIRSVLRAPDLSPGKGNGGVGPVFHVVDHQNVARD